DRVSTTGGGLSIVVNSSAGDPAHDEIIAKIESELPDVTVVRVDDVALLEEGLTRVARASEAIGAIGGDGTVGATAAAALAADIPLAVFPGGTLNHFARDARVDTVADAIRAVQNRRLVSVDTGLADGRTFVNTTSLGSYSTLVELREQYEKTLGKWPAVVIALLQILIDGTPFTLSINGERRRIWMIFIGNCSYEPAGFAPSARHRLDDGLFDVRIVDADHPFARIRLIAALLTGRLARSAVYSRVLVDRIDIEVDDAAPLLAADGEVFPAGARSFAITKNPQPLRLFVAAESE
ncbi:MAG: diacylglycerol kinase family protein, partial [Ilumatobacter sp.]|uniref:diacylglycerol/lipid kinase family protein n=1 Tax=Ilumatobacter sp. TaxID=1967498 RepID=UPI003298758B